MMMAGSPGAHSLGTFPMKPPPQGPDSMHTFPYKLDVLTDRLRESRLLDKFTQPSILILPSCIKSLQPVSPLASRKQPHHHPSGRRYSYASGGGTLNS